MCEHKSFKPYNDLPYRKTKYCFDCETLLTEILEHEHDWHKIGHHLDEDGEIDCYWMCFECGEEVVS